VKLLNILLIVVTVVVVVAVVVDLLNSHKVMSCDLLGLLRQFQMQPISSANFSGSVVGIIVVHSVTAEVLWHRSRIY
jgi:hypothetical protein